jgi:predicted CoA-binding protein
MATRELVDSFLALKRIALIGASRDEKAFSRGVLRLLVQHGYDVLPVNPNLAGAEGLPCYTCVGAIAPPVEGAMIMTAPSRSEGIVRECARAGVRRVWLGRGAVSAAAVAACRETNMEVVAGECPFMYLSGRQFPHNVHAWIRRLTFTFPR